MGKSRKMSDNQDFKASSAEWTRTDRMDGIWWGAAFIWGALVLLLSNTLGPSAAPWWDSWGIFFAGLGLIALGCTVARLQMPQYRAKWLLSLMFAAMFLAIGLGAWGVGWWMWVLVLLIVGAIMLRSALTRDA